MSSGHAGERLSWGDALFLYLERAGMPLNIASVLIFDGDIPLRACTNAVASKLPLLPRYQQRVVVPPWNVGFPTWEDDPGFDIGSHIREVTLKRGTEAELKALAGKLLSTVMDRRRPLWDFTLVRGLEGARTGLLVRVHHCMADGIAGLGLIDMLMGPGRKAPPVLKRKRAANLGWGRSPSEALLGGWISSLSDFGQRVLAAQLQVLSLSQRIAAAGGDWPVGEFVGLLPELTAPPERLFFNTVYRGPQKFAWVKIPLGEIKAIREKCGGTHNDVVLALITATIRSYAELHGDKVKGRLLRMMVPVSFRGSESGRELGNRISILPVNVPLGIRSPRKLLAAVHRRMEFLKRGHIAELVGLAGGLVGLVPAPLQAVAGPLASLLPITPFNLVCTNIRGPESPLYFAGHRMLDWYPYVPIGGEMTMNCAVLSYNDVTFFGFSGDAKTAPDLAQIERLLRTSFRDLRAAAGREGKRGARLQKPGGAERVAKTAPSLRRKTQPSVSAKAGPVRSAMAAD